jgi:hypothetical protein
MEMLSGYIYIEREHQTDTFNMNSVSQYFSALLVFLAMN